MDYQGLKALIITHPQWPSVTNADLVTWVNNKIISKEHETLPSGTVLSTILSYTAEWTPISDANKQLVRDILYTFSGEGIPTAAGTPARSALVAILGTNTKSALAAAISYTISRAENIGIIEPVAIWHIEEARRLAGL
jgi:hypothetical protein